MSSSMGGSLDSPHRQITALVSNDQPVRHRHAAAYEAKSASPDTAGVVSGRARREPERWVLLTVAAIIAVLLGGLVVSYAVMRLTENTAATAVTTEVFRAFDFTAPTIASWVTAMLWACLGVITLVFAAVVRRRRLSFAFFALVALYASIDSFTDMHQRLGEATTPLLPAWVTDPVAAWADPRVIAAVVVAALLLRLVLAMPARARNWILLGAAVFLAGALGVEWIAQTLLGVGPEAVLPLAGLEACLKLAGIGMAIAALVSMMDVTLTNNRLLIGVRRSMLDR